MCMYTCQIEQDAYQDDLGFSTGWIGKSSSGKVRGPAVSDKTQVSISKRLQVHMYICTHHTQVMVELTFIIHIATVTTATSTSVWREDFSPWDDVRNCLQYCIYSSTSMYIACVM